MDCGLVDLPDPIRTNVTLASAIFYWARIPRAIHTIDYRSFGFEGECLLYVEANDQVGEETHAIRARLLTCIQTTGGLTYKTVTHVHKASERMEESMSALHMVTSIPMFNLSSLEMLHRAHPSVDSWSHLEVVCGPSIVSPSTPIQHQRGSYLLWLQMRWGTRILHLYPVKDDELFDTLCSQIAMSTSDDAVSV